MEVTNKTAKNLKVGDFIALNINENGGKYAVGKNRTNETTIFAEITNFGLTRIAMGNVKMVQVIFANNETLEVESSASRYAIFSGC